MSTFFLYMELTLFEIFRRLDEVIRRQKNSIAVYHSLRIFGDGSGCLIVNKHAGQLRISPERWIFDFENEADFMRKITSYANKILGDGDGQ